MIQNKKKRMKLKHIEIEFCGFVGWKSWKKFYSDNNLNLEMKEIDGNSIEIFVEFQHPNWINVLCVDLWIWNVKLTYFSKCN